MQFRSFKPLAHILLLLLAACGGGGGGGAVAAADPVHPPLPTPQQQIAALEANGILPKLDRSPGLAGPDANANGVRDDVDAFIATTYAAPAERAAVQQMAASLQAEILVDVTDPVAVRALSVRGMAAVACIYRNFSGLNGTKQPSVVAGEVVSITTNTKTRLLKYLAYSKALDGTTMAYPEGNTCE